VNDLGETDYKEQVLKVEPFGIEAIPDQERHGRIGQTFTLWSATNLNVVTWFTGFLGVEFGLGLKYAVLSIILGNIIGAAFLGLACSFGPALGRPLIPASERAFGKLGIRGLSLLNFINNIGWLAINLVLAVMALQQIWPLKYLPALLIIAGITMVIAVYGYNFIHTFAHWMSIAMGSMFLIMTVIALHNLPDLFAGAPMKGGFDPGMFILSMAVTFSYQISYCPIGADYTRYLPGKSVRQKIWLAAFGGSLSICLWLEILGAMTAALFLQANGNPISYFASLMGAFTIPAMAVIILSTLPVNAMAIYSSGLAAQCMGFPLKRYTTAALSGGIGVLLVASGNSQLTDTDRNFLLLLTYWIAPWLGIIFVDFSLAEVSTQVPGKYPGIAGNVAFLTGIVISVPFMNSVLFTGPLAQYYLGGADISYFISLMVSASVYYVLPPRAASLFLHKSVDLRKV
jgi:nucleobase:cation symporter-1, NCS1 family